MMMIKASSLIILLCCSVYYASGQSCSNPVRTVTLSPGQSTTFTSPGFSGNYNRFVFCGRDVQATPGSKLTVQCTPFRVTGFGANCNGGFLYMAERNILDATRRFCGNFRSLRVTLPTPTNTQTGYRLQMLFWGGFYQNQGFSCRITAGDATPPPPATPAPVSSNCRCGIKFQSNRIVGGNVVTQNEYPWQASIRSRFRAAPFCGGTLISSRHVLSAAHCFRNPSSVISIIRVVLGDHNVNVNEGFEREFSLSSIVNHPSYDSRTNNYDFSILTLNAAVSFSNRIAPACLPAFNAGDFTGRTATVTGWGRTSQGGQVSPNLREVDVPIISNSQCSPRYNNRITSAMVCAGFPSGGRDSCQGDSGGPMVVRNGQNYDVVGVVSFGAGCALPNFPGVYARVTAALTWINSQTSTGAKCRR